jgi:DNA invertase Pin-like site-specific DNA recombinase
MEKLIFAPLIRVSTEAQEKRGESLKTQRKQLQDAIDSLGGTIYRWYAGNEHATPGYEHELLDSIVADAIAKKHNAVIVTDISRWSRDNEKNKRYLRILRQNHIRFFVGAREYDLYDPTQSSIIGLFVEMGELYASEQSKKSIENRIERAKRGFPSCGKRPYGRRFSKEPCKWEVDEEAKKKIEEIARLYLEEDTSWNVLGKKFGMNGTNLHKILTRRCGDTWEISFVKKDLGINETVTVKIPPLLPDSTIRNIREKSLARRIYEHGSIKYEYLLGRKIFDADTGYALTGTPNAKGVRYYRPFTGSTRCYLVNADVLEDAVWDALMEVLSNNRSLRQAVFEGNSLEKVMTELEKRKDVCNSERESVKKKMLNITKAIENFEGENVKSLVSRLKDLEKRDSDFELEIQTINDRLNSLPTEQEIIDKRAWLNQLLQRVKESYYDSGNALNSLPFKEKKKIINLVFGGKDETGKRYGIFIKPLYGKPKKYRFEAYGRLGSIDGWFESRTGKASSFYDSDVFFKQNETVNKGTAAIVIKNFPELIQQDTKHKVHMHCERNAHNCLCFH